MTTARLISKTSAGIALVWCCIGTLTALGALWVFGVSMRPTYAISVAVVVVAGGVVASRLHDEQDSREPGDDTGGDPT